MPWVLVAGGSYGGACRPSGVLWWCLGGLRTEMGGSCGARSRLVDFWVMHGMVMDEKLHVFPGHGVGELFRVCQQEVLWVSCRVAPPVMGVRADSPEASVKKSSFAGDGCWRRHGFMGR